MTRLREPKQRRRKTQPRKQPDLSRLKSLPDWAVLTEAEASAAASISHDTMQRLDKQGQGCPRTQLSEARFGYMVGHFKNWLQKRTNGGPTNAA